MPVSSPKSQKVRTVYVSPGEIAVSARNEILHSTPLGSCVAVMVYDKTTKTGGMAHVMLPGKARASTVKDKFKYAADAINSLLQQLLQAGVSFKNMEVCLAGGANVLKRPDDTIALDVANSVLEIIQTHKLKVKASSLGGTERRIAILMIEKGEVYHTLGNSSNKLLWEFFNEKNLTGR